MKVGLITIYGGANYGNKLQNYALQQFLKSKSIQSETIRYSVSFGKKNWSKFEKIKMLKKKYFSQGFVESIYNMKLLISSIVFKKELEKKKNNRINEFQRFEQENIVLSNEIFNSVEELKKCKDIYDYIIVGSDQVWNPYWQGSLDEYFLTFVPQSMRIAYAPSIAVSEIPAEQKMRYASLGKEFDKLSCREEAGCKVLQELTGKECLHVCDPVFLLSCDEWKKRVSQQKRKEVVTYFLGGKTSKIDQIIKKYAKDNECKIIDLWSEKDYCSSFVGVEKFLDFIANAEMFFTDSFHGCAFSIIFGTQFVICDRKTLETNHSMNSRLDSLMEKLDIKNRSINEFLVKMEEIDYKRVHEQLNNWSDESAQYLIGCLFND